MHMSLIEIFVEECSYNDIAGMKRCIENGVDINEITLSGSSTHWARTPEALKVLLEEGAEVNTTDEFGLNSLMSHLKFYERNHAWNDSPNMRLKYLNMLKLMVETHVNVNHQCKLKQTALMMVPDVEFAEVLLNAGADPRIPDREGNLACNYHWDKPATLALLENACLNHLTRCDEFVSDVNISAPAKRSRL